MNNLLCIVGPTATGKTARAIQESLKQPSILVSADSRQVYRSMDIVTGKDHPTDVPIYGTDIVNPDQACSVSVWYDAVSPHIKQAWSQNKQVIVVGGTGLYVKAVTSGIATMQVPINQPLRDELSELTISQLQAKLKSLDKDKFDSMNHSDKSNPRRLVRAVEVSLAPHQSSVITHLPLTSMIGLRCIDDPASPAGGSNHRYKITERVITRIKQGAIQETESLFKKYGGEIQSMSAIGYKSIINFIQNNSSQEEMIENWVEGELAYAKRQMTWFRKQPVIWYDIDAYGNSQN